MWHTTAWSDLHVHRLTHFLSQDEPAWLHDTCPPQAPSTQSEYCKWTGEVSNFSDSAYKSHGQIILLHTHGRCWIFLWYHTSVYDLGVPVEITCCVSFSTHSLSQTGAWHWVRVLDWGDITTPAVNSSLDRLQPFHSSSLWLYIRPYIYINRGWAWVWGYIDELYND